MDTQVKESEMLLIEAIRFEGAGIDARNAGDTSVAGRMFRERDMTFADALDAERNGN